MTDSDISRYHSTGLLLRGLYNIGNTCFLNSGLQLLGNCPEFVAAIHDVTLALLGPDGVNFHRLSPIFEEACVNLDMVFLEMIQDNHSDDTVSSPYNPVKFFRALCALFPDFSDSGEHDCHELLTLLLGSLSEVYLLDFDPEQRLKFFVNSLKKETTYATKQMHIAPKEIKPFREKKSFLYDSFLNRYLKAPNHTIINQLFDSFSNLKHFVEIESLESLSFDREKKIDHRPDSPLRTPSVGLFDSPSNAILKTIPVEKIHPNSELMQGYHICDSHVEVSEPIDANLVDDSEKMIYDLNLTYEPRGDEIFHVDSTEDNSNFTTHNERNELLCKQKKLVQYFHNSFSTLRVLSHQSSPSFPAAVQSTNNEKNSALAVEEIKNCDFSSVNCKYQECGDDIKPTFSNSEDNRFQIQENFSNAHLPNQEFIFSKNTNETAGGDYESSNCWDSIGSSDTTIGITDSQIKSVDKSIKHKTTTSNSIFASDSKSASQIFVPTQSQDSKLPDEGFSRMRENSVFPSLPWHSVVSLATCNIIFRINSENKNREKFECLANGDDSYQDNNFSPPKISSGLLIDPFQGLMVTEIECHNCQRISRLVSPFTCLIIDIPSDEIRIDYHCNLKKELDNHIVSSNPEKNCFSQPPSTKSDISRETPGTLGKEMPLFCSSKRCYLRFPGGSRIFSSGPYNSIASLLYIPPQLVVYFHHICWLLLQLLKIIDLTSFLFDRWMILSIFVVMNFVDNHILLTPDNKFFIPSKTRYRSLGIKFLSWGLCGCQYVLKKTTRYATSILNRIQSSVRSLGIFSPFKDVLNVFKGSVLPPLTLIECLNIRFQPQSLTGANAYSCSWCQKKSSATKTEWLLQLPENLLIQMKRFEAFGFYSYEWKKKDTPVLFPCGSPCDHLNQSKSNFTDFTTGKCKSSSLPVSSYSLSEEIASRDFKKETLDLWNYFYPELIEEVENLLTSSSSKIYLDNSSFLTSNMPSTAIEKDSRFPSNHKDKILSFQDIPLENQLPSSIATNDRSKHTFSAINALQANFALSAVVNHHSSDDGFASHYTAYVHKTDSMTSAWINCNDHHLSAVDVTEVADSEEYILMYKRLLFTPYLEGIGFEEVSKMIFHQIKSNRNHSSKEVLLTHNAENCQIPEDLFNSFSSNFPDMLILLSILTATANFYSLLQNRHNTFSPLLALYITSKLLQNDHLSIMDLELCEAITGLNLGAISHSLAKFAHLTISSTDSLLESCSYIEFKDIFEGYISYLFSKERTIHIEIQNKAKEYLNLHHNPLKLNSTNVNMDSLQALSMPPKGFFISRAWLHRAAFFNTPGPMFNQSCYCLKHNEHSYEYDTPQTMPCQEDVQPAHFNSLINYSSPSNFFFLDEKCNSNITKVSPSSEILPKSLHTHQFSVDYRYIWVSLDDYELFAFLFGGDGGLSLKIIRAEKILESNAKRV